MVEPGADAARDIEVDRVRRDLAQAIERLRAATATDPGAMALDHGQVAAEEAVRAAMELLAGEAASTRPEPVRQSNVRMRPGRAMTAHDLLITVELVARALDPHNRP